MKIINYTGNKEELRNIDRDLRKYNELKSAEIDFNKDTKDRVNISLKDYERLKNELAYTKRQLNECENVVKDLARQVRISPRILLKSKITDNEILENPANHTYMLRVTWEFRKEDIL